MEQPKSPKNNRKEISMHMKIRKGAGNENRTKRTKAVVGKTQDSERELERDGQRHTEIVSCREILSETGTSIPCRRKQNVKCFQRPSQRKEASRMRKTKKKDDLP